MIERTQDRSGLWPEKLVADTAPNLAWLVEERGIEAHILVFKKSARNNGTFERSAFSYDLEDDSFVRPGGNSLRRSSRNSSTPRSGIDKAASICYRARRHDCQACAMRQRGTPNMPARKVTRSVRERARDLTRENTASDAFLVSSRPRKKVEMLFAHLKSVLKLGHLRLRGPDGAKDEFHFAAAAQNLRKLAKIKPIPGLAPG